MLTRHEGAVRAEKGDCTGPGKRGPRERDMMLKMSPVKKVPHWAGEKGKWLEEGAARSCGKIMG